MTTNRVGNQGNPQSQLPLSPLLQPNAANATAPTGAAQKTMLPAAAGAGGSDQGAKAGKNYNVAISPDAKDKADAHAKALNIARNTPDVREDRVAALKKQIAEGSYKVDAGGIADGMLREAIREHLAENER